MFSATLAVAVAGAAQAAAPAPASSPEISVAVLMFDGVQIIDFAAPYEVFGQAKFAVHTVSRDGKPVELIARYAKADRSLDVLTLPDPRQLAWQYQAARGGRWRVSLEAGPAGADGRYRLAVKAIRLE